jgi:integrase
MARLRARGPYWELAWSGPDINPATGKKARHSKLLGRRSDVPRRDAELALKQLQREIFLDENRLRAPTSPALIEWAREYLTWHALQYPSSHYRTAQVLDQHVLPDWEFRRLDDITEKDVEEKVSGWRGAGYRDHTITKHLRVVKAFFNRAVEKKLLAESPAETVMAPTILDSAPAIFYEQDELEALYLASSFDPHHPNESQHAEWHAPAWKLYANTGMRRGEGLILKKRWIKGGAVQILSTGEERTKSGEWREVPLFPGATEALAALDAILGEDRDYVLPQITRPSMSRAAAKCIARADLTGSLHTLRHTFISHLAMDANVPVRTIQKWAGHASIETTEKYMHLRRGAPPVQLAL